MSNYICNIENLDYKKHIEIKIIPKLEARVEFDVGRGRWRERGELVGTGGV